MRTDDDRLVTELRAVLDQVDQALAEVNPSTTPWAGIQRFIKASQVRRRRRIALVVGAAAVAVVSVLLVQGWLFPASNQGQAPVPTGPPFAQWSQPRGSLAGDQKWISEFQEYARTHWGENDGHTETPFKVPVGKNVRVLYASDVGDWRIGVAIGDWPQEKGRSVAEFYGRRGAPVKDMLAGNTGPAPEQTVGSHTYWNALSTLYSPRGLSPAKSRELRPSVYLLTDGAPEALVQEPPTIDAEGKVTQHTRRIEFHDGFAELTFDQPGHYAVVLPNQDPGYASTVKEENGYRDFLGGSRGNMLPADAASSVPARGGEDRGTVVAGLARATWSAVRQPLTEGRWQLLASEPGELTSKSPSRAAVGVLTLPSGARVLAAGRLSITRIAGAGGYVDLPEPRLDIARLLPKGDDAQDSIAWWMDATDDEPARTAAMGPTGTARVEWVFADGSVQVDAPAPVVDSVDRRDVSEVRFVAVDGTELGRTKPLVPSAERYDPKTSWDKADYSWMLPEVKDGLAGY
jgi:hypothetical protein